MNSKIVCIFFCLVMLTSNFGSVVPNSEDSNPSSSGTGGLADSPWPMFSYNAQRTGLSPYNTTGNDGQLKWNFIMSFWIQSSPVIDSNGTIYIHDSKGNLYAINPNGTEKWNISISGITQTPAIDSHGTIYIGSSDNKFYAINPDGTENWNFTTPEPVNSSPAIGSDGTIYFGTSDIPILFALNPDGTEKWRFQAGSGGQTSSPGIGMDGTIYIGSSDTNLYAINPDGTEKWRFTSAIDYVQSAPAIDSDGTIYVGSRDNNLYAIHPDGSEKWRFTTGGTIGWGTSAAIGPDGTIYIDSGDSCLYAINPDGTEKWIYTTGGGFTTPSIGSEGTVYVGGHDNNLHAINPDGTEKWNFATGYIVNFPPSIGSDGTIYVCSFDNKLYAIGSSDIPPIANAGPDQTLNEGDTVQFDASSSYDLDGIIESYELDFDASDGLWWETGATPDATSLNPTHTYGDDGEFVVTLRVIDNENLTGTDTCNITVKNVNPTVSIESTTMNVEVGLRVAGRKYNEVGMTLFEDGNSIGNVSIERMPGSPDEQMAWIPINIDFSKSYSATVTFTPENPPNIGANPVWIYIKSENGSIKKVHHTFNVQQSKKRDSDHWNHIEPWEVDLSGHFVGLPFEIISHITDPGSDDEYLTYTYGSQIVNVTYLNNPPIPDPYPSPDVKPVDLYDTTNLVYEGPGTVYLSVIDDDGGIGTRTITIL